MVTPSTYPCLCSVLLSGRGRSCWLPAFQLRQGAPRLSSCISTECRESLTPDREGPTGLPQELWCVQASEGSSRGQDHEGSAAVLGTSVARPYVGRGLRADSPFQDRGPGLGGSASLTWTIEMIKVLPHRAAVFPAYVSDVYSRCPINVHHCPHHHHVTSNDRLGLSPVTAYQWVCVCSFTP